VRWWEDPERRCAKTDPEIFFPVNVAGERVAQAYCRACPVREECLADAMKREGKKAHSGRDGIFGGLTEKERARLSRGGRIVG